MSYSSSSGPLVRNGPDYFFGCGPAFHIVHDDNSPTYQVTLNHKFINSYTPSQLSGSIGQMLGIADLGGYFRVTNGAYVVPGPRVMEGTVSQHRQYHADPGGGWTNINESFYVPQGAHVTSYVKDITSDQNADVTWTQYSDHVSVYGHVQGDWNPFGSGGLYSFYVYIKYAY